MTHGEQRDRGWLDPQTEKPANIFSGKWVVRVGDRYCAHCGQWVECVGTLGEIRFLLEHDHRGERIEP